MSPSRRFNSMGLVPPPCPMLGLLGPATGPMRVIIEQLTRPEILNRLNPGTLNRIALPIIPITRATVHNINRCHYNILGCWDLLKTGVICRVQGQARAVFVESLLGQAPGFPGFN